MYVDNAKTETPPPSYSETLGPDGQPASPSAGPAGAAPYDTSAIGSAQPPPGGFVAIGSPAHIPQPHVHFSQSPPQHVYYHHHHHTPPPPPMPMGGDPRYLSPLPSGYAIPPYQHLLVPYQYQDPPLQQVSLEMADSRARGRFWGAFFWAFFIWWIVWVFIGIEADILFGENHRWRHGDWDLGKWWSQ